jgi:hypothetical protein
LEADLVEEKTSAPALFFFKWSATAIRVTGHFFLPY